VNILEGFDLDACRRSAPSACILLIEAKKLAFADRNRYAGDPAFVRWPLDTLISKAHAARRRARSTRRSQGRRPVRSCPEHAGDTSYFTVADGNGNAISFIHSLSNAFGSCVVAGENRHDVQQPRGRGFSLDPGASELHRAGRRTMHTLNCYMVHRDGKPWLVGGTPGGDQQTQWSTQMITDGDRSRASIQDAIDAPRFHSFPGTDPGESRQAGDRESARSACRGDDRRARRARPQRAVVGPWGRRRRGAVDPDRCGAACCAGRRPAPGGSRWLLTRESACGMRTRYRCCWNSTRCVSRVAWPAWLSWRPRSAPRAR
jgi:gamma-glutamyltranspeptidase